MGLFSVQDTISKLLYFQTIIVPHTNVNLLTVLSLFHIISKFSICIKRNIVQAIAQEWESQGICVNCINPERTKTPMRVRNFGVEPEDSLLSSQKVAQVSVQSLLTDFTGQVIDVKREEV